LKRATKRTVLVTGASGAVGSAVVQRLSREGCRVRGLVRGAGASPAGETVRGSLDDQATLRRAAAGVDLAVHCAAERSSDLEACLRANVDGVHNLIDALTAGGCRLLVHISTLSVYDDAGGPTFDEDSALWTEPSNAYGFTKAESERIIARAAARGLEAVILRPGMVLSMHPRSRWGPLAIERVRTSAESSLPVAELPHVHVANLVDAIVLAARSQAARGRAYNVIDGVAPTAEYLDVVYRAAGRDAPAAPADLPIVCYRADRIRRELRWAPRDRWHEFLRDLSAAR
jgi:nucleoside-diphosphate-sugar epimerase